MSCFETNACVVGACVETNLTDGEGITFTCQCQPGWKDDFSMFHQPGNCGIQEHVLLAIFLVFGIGMGVPMLVIFVRATLRSNGRMRKTGIASSIASMVLFLATMTLYLEGGVFEATSLMIGLNNIMSSYVSESVLMMMVAPIVAVRHRHLDATVPQRLHRIMWLLRCTLFIPSIVLSGLSHTPYFNTAFIAFLLVIMLVGIISVALQLWFVNLLQEAIVQNLFSNPGSEGKDASQRIEELLERLRKSRKALIGYGITIVVSQISVVSVYLALQHKFPFVWCIWPLMFLNQAFKYRQCFLLFKKSSTELSGSKGTAASKDSKPGQHEVIAASHVAPASEATSL